MKEIQSPPSRVGRVLSVVVPVLVLVVLVLVGRRVAVTEAAAGTPSSEPDAGAPYVDATTDATDADAAEAARESGALETLPDGAVIVDLNLANEDELRKLPGIGPGRARKIVELRTRLGKLKSIDDLARIKGFGRALVKRLRPLVRT